jgi:small neutral amino acid transporter SnatA (MarC family)
MHLLLPLASILGIEVEDLLERFKQNAIAWSAIAFFALVGAVFLLVALHTAMVDWLGSIWGPLAIAGGALLIALAIYVGVRIAANIVAHREAQRRHSAEKTALVTTAAITAVPMLLKSPIMKTIGIPVGGALAALYLLSKPGGHPKD